MGSLTATPYASNTFKGVFGERRCTKNSWKPNSFPLAALPGCCYGRLPSPIIARFAGLCGAVVAVATDGNSSGTSSCGKWADGLEPGGSPSIAVSVSWMRDLRGERARNRQGWGCTSVPRRFLQWLWGHSVRSTGTGPGSPPRVPALRPSSQGLSKFSRPPPLPRLPWVSPPLK